MSEYDPKNDKALSCACSGEENYDELYAGGWDAYFAERLVPQQLILAVEESSNGDLCPRSVIRHAVARLATAIAMVQLSESKSSVDTADVMRELESMLGPMIEDARGYVEDRDAAVQQQGEREVHVPTSGWKRRLN